MRVIIRVDEQAAIGSDLDVPLPESIQIDVEQGIAIQKNEAIGQLGQRVEHGAGSPPRLAVHVVANLNTEPTAVAEMRLDDLSPMAGEEAHVMETVLLRQLQLVF